ncbi:MAG: GNAT family N-acetyltransferase [Chloroflexi bacterium]|nr:GNAT family N-acetyltransferase [Chloroflexota bacterium]
MVNAGLLSSFIVAVSLATHPYRHADLARVAALLEARLAAGLPWNLSVAEIRQVLPRGATDTERNGHIWEDSSGRLVGFGLVWPPTYTLQLLVHPAHDVEQDGDPALLDAMLAWADGRAAALAHQRAQPVTLHARPRDSEARLVALLERHGFAREEWHTPKYRRALTGPVPEPVLPPGFSVRHVRGEDEVDAYVALHREAFGTQHMQVEERLALMRDPDYVPELDLVAVARDGTLAAFVVGGVDRDESRYAGHLVGYTDPIGTRPAYRRLGLARALLYEAFRRLQQRDVAVTTVGTGSWNVPTMRLVESVGYQLEYRLLAYAKTVS